MEFKRFSRPNIDQFTAIKLIRGYELKIKKLKRDYIIAKINSDAAIRKGYSIEEYYLNVIKKYGNPNLIKGEINILETQIRHLKLILRGN